VRARIAAPGRTGEARASQPGFATEAQNLGEEQAGGRRHKKFEAFALAVPRPLLSEIHRVKRSSENLPQNVLGATVPKLVLYALDVITKTGILPSYLLTFNRNQVQSICRESTGEQMGEGKADVLQGTLDLMVLKTLESMGPLHGYGIARRIEQVSNDTLNLNQGTIYPALLRLQQRGWITTEWGTSENNRRAKYYSLSRLGKKQIEKETESWQRIAATMARFLAAPR
jgi:transcriptional regulator